MTSYPGEALQPVSEVKTVFEDVPIALSAYQSCLDFEWAAVARNDCLATVIQARVLGHLLRHSPSHAAMEELSKEIHLRHDDFEALSRLGAAFINLLISPFKKSGCTTPSGSECPSPRHFDKGSVEQKAVLEKGPEDHCDAKQLALLRDGLRCVVSEKYDRVVTLEVGYTPEQIGYGVCTRCAHILPDPTYFTPQGRSASPDQQDDIASAVAVLNSYGYDVDKLGETKVHSLANAITLGLEMFKAFSDLELWLEATPVPFRYQVKTASPHIIEEKEVNLFTSHPDLLPPPSPELLALHAFCAKIANLSGAVEFLGEADDELDELANSMDLCIIS